MYSIGYDIGSSSIKAALVEVGTGKTLARVSAPDHEMAIQAPQPGWAEQDPAEWYRYLVEATRQILARTQVRSEDIRAVGISYQMHGLVIVDDQHHVLRPAIIWCDGRAVTTGAAALETIGPDRCLNHHLNSPGNFTASKLRWVADHEPHNYARVKYAMLPGDYLALRLTGKATTTVSGLSEGVLWDFKEDTVAQRVLSALDIGEGLLPPRVPTFGPQGKLTDDAAKALGLPPGTPLSYRAGDQPSNALALNVLQPGEVAATCGTSGVVYGLSGQLFYDPGQRVNSFAHVNHRPEDPRIGVLLCINGAGILYRWLKQTLGGDDLTYAELETLASKVSPGCSGLHFLPFGNGPERMLQNRNVGAHLLGIDLNRHGRSHIIRAGLEGVAFAFVHGMRLLQTLGLDLSTIRAGNDNLFQSPIFSSTIAQLTGATIEIRNTTGATGAALGAAAGAGLYKSLTEAVQQQAVVDRYEPGAGNTELQQTYARWETSLQKFLIE